MHKINQPYDIAEANWKTVKDTSYKVALFPWGATEAHNYHLPYATDNIQADYLAKEAGRMAYENGTPIAVLPTVPFGINTGQLDIKLCLNLLPSTQMAILRDIADVLVRHQIEKLVLLNGHGGNNFKNMIREMSFLFPNLFICWVNWYQLVDWNLYFDDPGDHAGEMETSAIMHIRPDLVRPLSEAGAGAAKTFKLSGFKEGWATAQRAWTQITADTGVGDPSAATPAKGEKYLRDCVRKLATFLIELHQTDNDDLYE